LAAPILPANNDDKLWAGLGYVGLTLLMVPTIVILVLKKDESAYIKFHLLQSLAYGITWLVIGIAFSIVSMVPVVGLLAGFASLLVWLVLFGYWIVLIIWSFTGKDFRIPVLGDFVEQQFMK
jgi:uncharacterized membrane protein